VPSDAAFCPGTIAVVAGSTTSLTFATFTGTGPWSQTAAGGVLKSPPSIVSTGAGAFHVVLRGSNYALQYATRGSSWSGLAQIAADSTIDTPSLASDGAGKLHVVYRGSDSKFYHGTFTGSWDAAADPVGGSAAQSYGPSAPAAAWAGGLVVVQDGSNGYLYDLALASSAWTATEHPQALVATQGAIPSPSVIALSGGTSDLLVVFAHQGDYKLTSQARASGTWSAPALIDPNAYTTDPVALAALSGGRAVMVFRGGDQKAYFSLYNPSASSQWTAPAPLIAPNNPVIAGLPAVAPGICGDDAVAVYPPAPGQARLVRLRGGSWVAPEAIPGTTASAFVGVATSN
jgi:hypothetical protein